MKKNTWSGKHGPLLIAEIGGNHEGDFGYAQQLTELAIGADVDFIKYQLYTGDTLVSRKESPVRNKHFKKFELQKEQYIQLAERCREAGIGFMASVWDLDFLDWIDRYLPIYKIGSGDMTAYPVLRRIAQLKKPIILSTGLSSLQEVLETVAFLQKEDNLYCNPNFLSILQCTSMYPIPPSEAHLSVMQTYAAVTGLPVGYSDHTEGSEALAQSVAMGAKILEFHFTDSREGKAFRDHKVSLTQAEVLALIERIKIIQALNGDPIKRPLAIEGDHVTTFRRAIYPKVAIPAGTLVEDKHLTCLRPNHGIDARDYDRLIGMRSKVGLEPHQRLEWEYFQK